VDKQKFGNINSVGHWLVNIRGNYNFLHAYLYIFVGEWNLSKLNNILKIYINCKIPSPYLKAYYYLTEEIICQLF
jgi:hypothetical protein